MVRLGIIAVIAGASACSGRAPTSDDSRSMSAPVVAPARPPDGDGSRPTAATPPGRVVVAVTSPDALAVVAAAGGRWEDLLSADSLRAIGSAVDADIAAIRAGDKAAGVGIRRHAHRLFDASWLTAGRWDLVGVVTRLDRAGMPPGSCGDTRLVYRLGYETEDSGVAVASRLPMTAAVILDTPPADSDACRSAASRWRAPADATGAGLGTWLVSDGGPLGDGALAPARVTRVLTNFQAVRWPSTVQPDLGGHAEYVLREFSRDPATGALTPVTLSAVPDVARIRGDAALRARLLAWVREPETIAAADRGHIQLPDELRAATSIGVTPRGFSRRSNRPFRSLIEPKQLADLELDTFARTSSPEALLRRLDELTCAGCHQARTVSGFHLLGEDGPDVAFGSALAVPMSPHLIADLDRRRAIVEALVAGDQPELAPPMAERAPSDPGGPGAACGLGDPAFASWTCAAGLTCSLYDAPADDRVIGRCVSERESRIGEPCEVGTLLWRDDSRLDRVPRRTLRGCEPGTVCKLNRKGFPGGMCAAQTCRALPEGAICALIAGPGFDRCLVAGNPFPVCIRDKVMEIGLRPCSETAPCRDDYICARTPDGKGACVPPYFLFPLRVDGHPTARAQTTR